MGVGEGNFRELCQEAGLAGPRQASSHSPTAASDLFRTWIQSRPSPAENPLLTSYQSQLSDPVSSLSFARSHQDCLLAFALASPSGLLITPPSAQRSPARETFAPSTLLFSTSTVFLSPLLQLQTATV